jgi:hypothetical protein
VNQTGNPFLDFTDAHLKAAMLRALRLVAILAAIAGVALWVTMGWQTAMLLLSGALVSASGLWEWQKLIALINARLDEQGAGSAAGAMPLGSASAGKRAGGDAAAVGHEAKSELGAGVTPGAEAGQVAGPGATRVVLGFFLRLGVAGAVLYGSLRCFHGSVYALVGGLGLAAFALGVEAVRLIRS